MAYLPMSEKDKEKQNESGGGTEQVISGSTGTVGDSAPGSSTGGSSQTEKKGSSSGSGWTNLQNYVTANRGEDKRMGEAVQSNVAGKANEADEYSNAFQTTANERIEKNTIRDDGIVDQIKTNASGITSDDDRMAQYSKQYNATWEGPQDYTQVDGFTDTSQKYDRAEDSANAAGDFSGRTALLDEVYSAPQYSAGEKRFDSFLVGAGDDGKQIVQDVQRS